MEFSRGKKRFFEGAKDLEAKRRVGVAFWQEAVVRRRQGAGSTDGLACGKKQYYEGIKDWEALRRVAKWQKAVL